MEQDYIKHIKGAERRFFTDIVEARAEKTDRFIRGRGIVYNSLSENFAPWKEGGLYEVIERGAATGLLDDEDIMVLFNHDASQVLARNKNTAKLTETPEGVYYEFEAPDTTTGNDVMTNVRLKNVRKSSFAFLPKDVVMERMVEYPNMGRINIRRITKFDRLFDMSVVTSPAYNDTEVMARSIFAALDEMDKTKKETDRGDAEAILRNRAYEVFKVQNTI